MKYILAFLFLTLIAGCSAQSQLCSGAVAFCGNSVFVPGTTGTGETGPNYGCLGSEPAPAWFFFQIASGNNITIDFTNTNNVDIDYAIWGPFVTVAGSCDLLSSQGVGPVACSFSTSAVEQAQLLTVNPGEIYLMIVTNFAQADTVIQVNVDFTTTNGDLNCGIVSPSATPTPVVAASASASTTDNLGEVCSDSDAFCGLSSFNPGTTGAAQFGPNYGCLGSQPAPAWFNFQIASGNNITIDFTNTNSVDIDYAIWGPFATPDCTQVESGLVAPISCSFSTSAVEQAQLLSINPGEFYVMLITNFAQAQTVITANVDFTTTNGDLNCAIVSPSATSTPAVAVSATASSSDFLGEVCTDADPFCGLSTFNPGTTGDAQFGPNYGCLGSQPAPAWFFFRIGSGNNITIDFTNVNAIDIDYAIWGPFASADCTQVESGLVSPVSCSFSSSAVEQAQLLTVNPGEFYIMLITNFGRSNTVITANVDFTNTNGDLDCGIVPGSASPSFSPSTSFTSSPSFTPSTTPSTSFSPSTSLTNSITPSNSESNSITPSRSATPSLSESNSASSSRTPSNSVSLTRSTSPTISLTRSSTATRTPSRTPTVSPTPSRTSRRSRSQTPTTTPTGSESRTPRASRSNTPSNTPTRSTSRSPRASRSNTPSISVSQSFQPPRTTGLRTTGAVVARTTGVINRTTGVINRTTGVINRTTGVINRTTGVNPSSTPTQSEIIISSSAAFSASPFFSLMFVVVALAFTIIA